MSKKEKYVDDGHTIYNMDVDGLKKRYPKSQKITLSNKEKIALIKAILIRYIPILFGLLMCFGLTMFFIYLWLN